MAFGPGKRSFCLDSVEMFQNGMESNGMELNGEGVWEHCLLRAVLLMQPKTGAVALGLIRSPILDLILRKRRKRRTSQSQGLDSEGRCAAVKRQDN